MAGGYGPSDEREALRTLDTALERGVSLLDTSDAYAAGENEKLIARAIKGRRDKAFIVTKFGNPCRDGQNRPIGVCGAPDYVPVACERSLRRLEIDVIDLYLVHRIDPKYPIEDTVGALAALIRQGKVRNIGLCEAAPDTIRRAHLTHPLSVLQSEYSLWTRDPETGGHLAVCRELGISFMAYSPLGRGFLTGAIDGPISGTADIRATMPRFSNENMPANLAALARFKELSTELGATPSQLALAWLLARGEDILPIPGTRHRRHLEENIAAADIILTAADIARIDEALAPGRIAGARYSEEYSRVVNL
jgi:aryl-alcohol dehydrogenase-like predicted oxidoreductase